MPGTTGAGGNILYQYLCIPTLTPVSVAANTTAEQSFTVMGLQTGDNVDVYYYGTNINTPAAQLAGIGIVNNRVSAPNTLQIGFINSTAGALTPLAGIYYMCVTRPENFTTLPASAA